MKAVRVEVNDKMQKRYLYLRTKPIGRAFRRGFTPELTPKQMLALGVFGGKYMTDCRKEFPANWFARAKLSPGRARPSLNYFGVNASQPLSEWRRKGWITHERRLLEVLDRQVFSNPADLARLLPGSLPNPFTTRELCQAAAQPEWLARKMIYCFRALGMVEVQGKRGRSILYTRQG